MYEPALLFDEMPRRGLTLYPSRSESNVGKGYMIVSREREKLIQAIVFFCLHTKHCHILKLFKLLNLLDSEHFRQTGRTVTGERYFAWPHGPVPEALWDEITKHPGEDLQGAIAISTRRNAATNQVERRDLRPKVKFNPELFTRRELNIMRRLELLFDTARGEDMSELSHMRGLPWREVWAEGKGKGKEIPIELALKSEPLVRDAPTIDAEELAYREELRKDLV
jgi:uncharacterized phage-associated protein